MCALPVPPRVIPKEIVAERDYAACYFHCGHAICIPCHDSIRCNDETFGSPVDISPALPRSRVDGTNSL